MMEYKNITSLKHKRAFTLVELLVVISIIALLLAILMPSLQKAREEAKKVVCKNNLRQVALGFHLYAEDYDNVFPDQKPGSSLLAWWYTKFLIGDNYWKYCYDKKRNPSYDWLKQTWHNRYIVNHKVLRCPSDKGDAWGPISILTGGGDEAPELDTYYLRLGSSYVYNSNDNGAAAMDYQRGTLMGLKTYNIRQTSSVIVLGDWTMWSYFGDGRQGDRFLWHDKKKPYTNIIFADLHVEGVVMTYDEPDYLRGAGWTFLAAKK